MLLYLIVLLEGFVTISFEILSIRQLIPVVGNSVVVTSLIIGFFLLFLAYGYRKGGTYDQDFSSILKRNFLLAALGLGLGLSYVFVELFFRVFSQLQLNSTLLPLIVYLSLIIAPVVYLLGQTVPITFNLWKRKLSMGQVGGQVLHVSTLGSFLGATITALVLLNYLGVAWSLFIDVIILILLALLLSNVKKDKLIYFVSVFLVLTVYSLNVLFEKSIFITTNNYGNYQVTSNKEKTAKVLIINNSYSSAIDNQRKGFGYIEFIKKIIFDQLQLRNKHILVLGAGGFTLSAEKTNDNHFVYVDIDERLPKIVINHFYTPEGQFIADDARHFVNVTDQLFDVVVSDTYSNGQAVTPHLLTEEYFAGIKKVLMPTGTAIFNIIGRPTFDDAYSKRVDATIRSVFATCVCVPMDYTESPTNLIYICKKSPYENDKMHYTDDLNNAALDFFAAGFDVSR